MPLPRDFNFPMVDALTAMAKVETVDKVSTIDPLIKVDRYMLSKTWYDLLQRMLGRNPNVVDKAMVGIAYEKIIARMKNMTDDEILIEMQDIFDTISIINLNITKGKKGYYRK